MPNRLANESSPYLLQHQNNPVDWYPWGDEAIGLAREAGKPIFLSIGYSACHWCHVMEHESFEHPQIADFLNKHFISIKVDREERPDLDQIYMNAVQLMTGRGGWPMSVFLTPELQPFYGGTYWPPTSARGMPGFDQVLTGVLDAWMNRPEQVKETAGQMTDRLRSVGEPTSSETKLGLELLEAAGRELEREFDPQHGGFGDAPKFPHSMDIQVLLRLYSRDGRQAWLDMVRLSLDKMAAGGLYDQLGGGFHRYSVDERWLVPHFEKMLYDNALLAITYLEAWQATGDPNYERVVRETLDYILRDMTDPAGGFYSTEDADSPVFDGAGAKSDGNEEGIYYTWSPDEVIKALGEPAAETVFRVYDVTPLGNFEGRSILNLPKTIAQQADLLGLEESELADELATAREKLLKVRDNRPRPGLDDKVLVAWNGLMIDAMARAGAALGEQRYLDAARKAAEFILREMRTDDGRLLHTWRGGEAKLAAYLDDYTALANGLISLYEATFDASYVEAAAELMDVVLERFIDAEDGATGGRGFFYTADDHEELLTRNKDLTDNATPGGNSLAATALVRLGKLTGDAKYLGAAHATLTAAGDMLTRAPMAMGQMLIALDLQLGPTPEFVLAGDDGSVAKAIHKQFLPRRVIASQQENPPTILAGAITGKEAIDGQPTLYVCENHTCQEPVVALDAIQAELDKLGSQSPH